MTDPLSRLRAGLDRDEAIARAARGDLWQQDGSWYLEGVKHAVVGPDEVAFTDEKTAEHIALHDPSRVLRQAEKLREAADLLDSAVNGSGPEPDLLSVCAELSEILASIYPEDATETGDRS